MTKRKSVKFLEQKGKRWPRLLSLWQSSQKISAVFHFCKKVIWQLFTSACSIQFVSSITRGMKPPWLYWPRICLLRIQSKHKGGGDGGQRSAVFKEAWFSWDWKWNLGSCNIPFFYKMVPNCLIVHVLPRIISISN